MSNVTNEKENALYTVRCTECGEVLENKFFRLDELLMQYHNGREYNDDMQFLFGALGIGAEYGGGVLPKVPQLLRMVQDEDHNEVLGVKAPQKDEINKRYLPCFEENNSVRLKDSLVEVPLNISSMVAQFAMTTGFCEIYNMLQLQWESRKGDLSDEKLIEMKGYQERFVKISGVKLSNLTVDTIRDQEIGRILDLILDYAEVEHQRGGDHFAVGTLYAGWQYKKINNRNMPAALVFAGDQNKAQHCGKCCCSGCRKPIPVELGAYEQKIVGILGTQQTGKSTYLAALTDAIEIADVTTRKKSNGEHQDSSIDILESKNGNPNYTKIHTLNEGMMWRYQHGFPPKKTPVEEILSLSFLIGRKNQDKQYEQELVMYTIVDIAGEIFINDQLPPEEQVPPAVAAIQKELLKACSALLFVVSSRQMTTNQALGPSQLERSPQTVLAAAQSFLPQRALPVAIILTSTDEINGGRLQSSFMVPYDLRNCTPLVWSDQKKKLVYNAEMMSNATRAVREFVNKGFGNFVELLQGCLKENAGRTVALAAFAVSSGTQYAPFDFEKDNDKPDRPRPENYHTEEQMELRKRKCGKVDLAFRPRCSGCWPVMVF